ncbi:MAG: hypothetical protein ACRC10_00230 [Thermoguttaceae bacterium]
MLTTLLFLGCALFGGTIMLFQFLLMLLGFGGSEVADMPDFNGTPTDHLEHPSSHGMFRIISFRTLIAGLTFFGLGGLAGISGADYFGVDPKFRDLIGIASALLLGFSALLLVYYLYSKMYSLRYDGSVLMETLPSAKGTVYVKIPANKGLGGKVLVNHQGRTMEYEAMTPGEALASGTPITVTRVVAENLLEVTPYTD